MYGVPVEVTEFTGDSYKIEFIQEGDRVLPYKFYTSMYDEHTCDESIEDEWKLMGRIDEFDGYQPTNIYHPCGFDNIITYDLYGNLTSVNTGGIISSYKYDNYWKILASETDFDNQVKAYHYDGFMRLSNALYRDGHITSEINYDLGEGTTNSISIEPDYYDASGLETLLNYDPLGRKIGKVVLGGAYGGGNFGNFTGYDELNRMVSQCNQSESTCFEYVYEKSPRERLLFSKMTNWSKGKSFKYFSQGGNFVNQVISENENITELHVNEIGRVLKKISFLNGSPVVETYTYNPRGQVETRNNDGGIYRYNYFRDGKLKNKKIPGTTGKYEYTYNERGLLYTTKDPNGHILTHHYDEYDRLTSVDSSDEGLGVIINQYYSFNSDKGKNGKLRFSSQKILGGGVTSSLYEYDEWGRMESEEYSHLLGVDVFSFTYNHKDELLVKTRTTWDGNIIVTVNDYDTGGRLLTTAVSVNGNTARVTDKTYNAHNKVVSDNINGLQTVDYGYNGVGWITSINDIAECRLVSTTPGDPTPDPGGDLGLITVDGNVDIEYNLNEIINGENSRLKIEVNQNYYSDNELLETSNESLIVSIGGAVLTQDYTHQKIYTIQEEVDPEIIAHIFVNDIERESGIQLSQESKKEIGNQIIRNVREIPSRVKCNNMGGDLFAERIYYDKANANLDAPAQYSGRISNVKWRIMDRDEIPQYGYQYDDLGRVTVANYTEYINESNTQYQNIGMYNTVVTYDNFGNIFSLNRNGFYTDGNEVWSDKIDQLTYGYENGILESIIDASSNEKGFLNDALSFDYDNNGNMVSQEGKVDDIEYNFLNLPKQIEMNDESSVSIFYDAIGLKVRKLGVDIDGNLIDKYYIRGIEYDMLSNEFVLHHENGRFIKNDEFPDGSFEFSIKDHLGNPRIYFKDENGDGEISQEIADGEVLQEGHFYPFGMNQEGDWISPPDDISKNPYLYNHKETNIDGGLNLLDYGARYYDATSARFTTIDPLAEENSYQSPYSYGNNDPIKNIDFMGLFSSMADINLGTYDSNYDLEADIKKTLPTVVVTATRIPAPLVGITNKSKPYSNVLAYSHFMKWFNTWWDHPIVRLKTGDAIHLGAGYEFTPGLGKSASIELRWILHGPEASYLPMLTFTTSLSTQGWNVGGTVNVGRTYYLGAAKNIRRDMVLSSPDGDQPSAPDINASFALAEGVKLGTTVGYNPSSNTLTTELNYGFGVPAGFVPANASTSQTYTLLMDDKY